MFLLLYSKYSLDTNLSKTIFPSILDNQALQTRPHTERRTQICKQTPAKLTWGGRQRTTGNVSTQGRVCHPNWHEGKRRIQREQSCTSADTRNSAVTTTPLFPADPHPRLIKKKQWKAAVAAWEWVMHVEGSLWKPVEGWMCGSFRPGDLSSTVETYKYLRSDIQTVPISKESMHVHTTREEHTCAHTCKEHRPKEV